MRFLLFKEEGSLIKSLRLESRTFMGDSSSSSDKTPLFLKVFASSPTKAKDNRPNGAMDQTRKYVQRLEKLHGSKFDVDSVAETPGFLPLLVLNELYEILRLKFSQYKKVTASDEPYQESEESKGVVKEEID